MFKIYSAITLIIFLLFISQSIAGQVSINDNENWCSSVVVGDNNEISVSCTGVDPEIVKNLLEKNINNEMQQNKILLEMNSLIKRYFNARNALEKTTINAPSTRIAWESLQNGEITKAEEIIDDIKEIKGKVYQIEENLNLSVLFSSLDRAKAERSGSMQGQIEAIEKLKLNQYTFDSSDFSGVSFEGANISNTSFKNSKFHLSILTGMVAHNINLADSDLRFADITGSDLKGSNCNRVFAPFLIADNKTSFENASIEQSDFFSANLKGVNFSGASLKGSSFAFADLRGANFKMANLSGAEFTGAVLDNANFEGAQIIDTNVIGASSRNIFLLEKQLSGLCRNPVADHRSSTEWHVKIVESDSNNKLKDTYDYGKFIEEWVYFKSFSDNSLPLCANNIQTRSSYDSEYPGSMTLWLREDYFLKAKRKTLVKKIINEHIAIMKGHLSPENIFKGNGMEINNWVNQIHKNKRSITTLGKPYVSTDQMLLLLLNSKQVDKKQLCWADLAKYHWSFDMKLHEVKNEFTKHTMWTTLFPKGCRWEDLPNSIVEDYKSWTLSRSKKAGTLLVFRTKAFLLKEQTETDWYASLNTGYLHTTIEGLTKSNSWPHSSIAKNIDARKAVFAPVRSNLLGFSRIIFIFPEIFVNYKIPIPKSNHKKAVDSLLDVELLLNVERFEKVTKDVLFVFVNVKEASVYSEGNVVSEGSPLYLLTGE